MKMLAALFLLVGCEPSPVLADADSNAKEAESSIRKLLHGDLGEDEKNTKFNTTFADLDEDGIAEAVTYVEGPRTCGSGGCTMYILKNVDGAFAVVTKLTVSRPPIRVLVSKSNGWHDLGVWVQGGGIIRGYEAHLRFDGKTYPSNPTVVEPVEGTSGKIVIDR